MLSSLARCDSQGQQSSGGRKGTLECNADQYLQATWPQERPCVKCEFYLPFCLGKDWGMLPRIPWGFFFRTFTVLQKHGEGSLCDLLAHSSFFHLFPSPAWPSRLGISIRGLGTSFTCDLGWGISSPSPVSRSAAGLSLHPFFFFFFWLFNRLHL